MIVEIPDDKKIYNDAAIAKISQQLDIRQDQLGALSDVLEKAARQFMWMIQHNNGFNEHQTNKKLHQLAGHMEKSIKLFHEITKQSKSGVWDLGAGISSVYKNHKEGKTLFHLYNSEYFITSERVLNLLDALRMACENAPTAHKPLPVSKWTKTQTVLGWLWDIDDFWLKNSEVPITEGRCEDGGIYTGKAVGILDLMAAPINNLMPPKYRISHSMNAEAIRLWRDGDPNENPYDQYTDDDLGLQ